MGCADIAAYSSLLCALGEALLMSEMHFHGIPNALMGWVYHEDSRTVGL
jgi:hypothetical protein